MENEIKSHDVREALEQIRAGFTVSRMALGAATVLYPLGKKDEKWAKKFTRIQNDYHKFLLDTYQELEKILATMKDNDEKTEE